MNNADLPAMPDEQYTGLTKREMFAMHEDVQPMFEEIFLSYAIMADFVGEEWDSDSSDLQNIGLEIKVKAKLRLMAADALLKELDKC